ncbi:hypothetical protein [Streptomyces europaeiscabiei]|uniref:hypothetical protein n=1 Tax=Streptomyces europaeiscabiei TaxID=146819 RepID=UPI002E16545B|nr:hypothetical protein OHB30_51250 [Streptomyces europaeiscabiei]
MERFGRWAAAGLVTVTGFTVPTWLCGALVLPPVLDDPAIRWSVASALGAAVAALAGMWGYGFATRPRERQPSGPEVQALGGRAVAVGGNNSGGISTGETGTTGRSPDHAGGGDPPPQPPARPASGTVTAAGERSIAIGGDNTGPLSTGDHHGGT